MFRLGQPSGWTSRLSSLCPLGMCTVPAGNVMVTDDPERNLEGSFALHYVFRRGRWEKWGGGREKFEKIRAVFCVCSSEEINIKTRPPVMVSGDRFFHLCPGFDFPLPPGVLCLFPPEEPDLLSQLPADVCFLSPLELPIGICFLLNHAPRFCGGTFRKIIWTPLGAATIHFS